MHLSLCSISYSFIEKIFYKSLVDGAPPDSMTKLRKQTSRNRLQNQLTAGSFRVSVYSRVKIKPVAETCSHYFLWCFFLVLFYHAGSCIRYVLYSYLFSYFEYGPRPSASGRTQDQGPYSRPAARYITYIYEDIDDFTDIKFVS